MKLLNILGKSKKAIGGIIAIILFIVAVFYAGMLFGSKNDEAEVTSTTLKNQIVEINELAVYSYDYSKVGKFSNNLTFYGWDVPLTQKSFLITFNGTIKAGVDFKKANIKVKNKIIDISLPQCGILSHEIDESSIEVYDESNNVFNQISINDYKTFAKKEKSKTEKDAKNNGILDKANERVKDILTTYLNSLPDIKDNYKINITIIEETSNKS
ncbi:MAG: DUF4230 domain-containing protein [Faecalibacillus sp.]